ncbi:MAG: DUF3291 domain-containing protein [Pseudomonadota bacterium]
MQPGNQQHIAHVNVAVFRYPPGDPRVQPFFDAVPRINAMAEGSPGFVWRETRDEEEARAADLFGVPNLAIALSVWEDVESLRNFVYRSAHADFLRQRTDWFGPWDGPNKALWFVDQGHQPSVEEAKHRLNWLHHHGDGDVAFGFAAAAVQQR